MTLDELLQSNSMFNQKIGISEERIMSCVEELRKAIAFYRYYPDLYIDFCVDCAPEKDRKNYLHLYLYQRVFLREAMRYRHFYATFPRAYSKSFLAVLVLMLRCIFYPNSHLFITTGGKEQATGIIREKAEELCKLIPGLRNEVNFERGKSKSSNDDFKFLFKNGSVLDVMAATQRSRGRRATGGLMEEVILIDGTLLNEVIIPTMNVDRRLPDGSRRGEEEIVNKSQIYVTTAGWKNSFAYDKLIMTLIEQITRPKGEALVAGGTWRIPVLAGLLSKNFVQQLKLDGTYNESSFDREYERWETEKPSIDIVVRRGNEYVPIELKYKLKAISGRISRFGEKSSEDVSIVTNQAAQNLGRYAFWKDVRRIELVKKHYRAVNAGIAVFLTNDESYHISRVGTNYYAFSMDEGRKVSGVLDWKVPNSNYPSIPLDGTYVIRWGKTSFNELMQTAYYTIVTI